ncbi:MAG: helix-turn-helix domain-containing protein [Candidatus Binataceae bacterium]|nr:helix-turn-helix domain-containing protein [Candidatus Binataceae bacterium]
MADGYRTLAEIAAELDVTPRWLREMVRDEKIPVLRRGRVIRFDNLAIRAIEESLRSPSKSSAGATPARSPSLALSPERALDAALKATTRPSPARKRRPSKRSSCATPGTGNVVALRASPRPP